jgi:ubiquinone/menaquinone biosynthesis C-methylase UbiE
MEKPEDYFIEVKTSFTDKIASKSADLISVEYSYMTLTEHLAFVSEIFNKLDINLEGDGMEVAAGAGVFACTLTRLFPKINKVYALEIVQDVVTKLQPKIIEATNMQNRVIPMIGDFNAIDLPDNSLDFVVGFSSLHHSNDLHQTLSEISRVLKPGGKLVFFDRAHPNHMTKAQETFLLNKEYSVEYKLEHGLDPNKPYRRFEEGEHEHRFRDWDNAFAGTGMSLDSATIFTPRTFKRFLKAVAAYIPYFIRAWFKKMQYLIEPNKLAWFYLFPYFGTLGKHKIYVLRTKFKTPAMVAAMRHMIFTATKRSS